MSQNKKLTPQMEFASLFERLQGRNITAKAVAEALKMTPGGISMILSGDRSPSALRLDAMRRFVSDTTGEPVKGVEVSDDLAIWRKRAITAEKELVALRNTLRGIAGATSSKASAEAAKLLKRMSASA